MKIFFRCIGNTVLGLMLVMALVLLIPGLFGIRPYVVYSGSMEPEIPVVKKEKDIFITKGDANKTEDPVPAEASQIIGRVVFHLPYLGYVIHFLKARIPFAAVCIAACLSVLFDLAYTPKKKKIQGGI